ncbi:hypothetical protein GMRT_13860 [Giardia muris]|uniref:Uncharacterized protein n=1 Tax=Giardia muris TaxID=5742 RepID=A0A4Z1T4J0_GIAMU|nr:hypothetical protein GMRT_13860 [Giardia muris]|eukprot:TNJ27351.1 hypothetical protein GMRT_13860 [Giardia muris]
MNIQTAKWTLERLEHEESIVIGRLNNLLSSNALFILAYFGLTTQFLEDKLKGFIRYTIPITLIIIIGVSLFNAVALSIIAFYTRRRMYEYLQSRELPTPPEPFTIFLSSMFLRSIVIPVCLGLIWDFILLDFQGGEIYYIITFTMVIYGVAGLCAIGYAILVLFLNKRQYRDR